MLINFIMCRWVTINKVEIYGARMETKNYHAIRHAYSIRHRNYEGVGQPELASVDTISLCF